MIRPLIVACLLLLASARPAGSEEPYNLKREVAWARAMWRADLKGVHFEAPIAKLLAWAPPGGTVKVWLFTSDDACTPTELRRVPLAHPTSRGETEVLTGKHFPSARPGPGGLGLPNPAETSRAFQPLWIGFELQVSSELCTEDITSGALLGCGGIGEDDQVYGALSDADSETARFGGVAIGLIPSCEGPLYWLKCRSGGKKRCRRCEQVALSPDEPAGWDPNNLESGEVFSRDATCDKPCPDPTPSPTLTRVHRLDERAPTIWRRSEEPPATVPSLHRTLAGCLRAHFPKGVPQK
jgi:hypothetical protein